MTQAEIEQKVIELAAEEAGVPVAQVSRASHFLNDLNYDSLGVMEFVMQVEDEFEISIGDDDVEKIKTVGDAVDYVVEKTNAVPAS